MTARRPSYRNRSAPPARQRGVVLFIALIVMVAMSLAAVALIRSVDTGTQVIANLAFRQASIVLANWAVERAAKGLFAQYGGPSIPDITVDDLAENYYATHNQAWDDPSGVPGPLQTKNAVATSGLGLQFNDVARSGNTVTYVVERMCNPDPALTAPQRPDGIHPPGIPKDATNIGWCDVIAPKGGGCHEINGQCVFDFPPMAYYRVTVRVDGPKNTVSFVQTMLRPPGT
jgi:type IV pilus assembly protein PilX